MDIEELNKLSNRIAKFKEKVKGEQATINTFILPFIRLLGYDDTNPTEVEFEYTADIGTKKGEKIDIAISKGDKVIMLIECKNWRSDLSKADFSQLYRYFNTVIEARIGVLTNGILYKFYTDAEKPNVMDNTTFFEFNMNQIQQPSVDVLKHFTKDNFDLDHVRSNALELKYRKEIKLFLEKQLKTPTPDFVEFFLKVLKSQMEVQDFTDVVKLALNEFMDEHNKYDPNRKLALNEFMDEHNKYDPNGKKTNRSKETPAKSTNLRVTMPDNSVIYHDDGTNTYLDVLEKLGLEKVMEVRTNIVSKEPFHHLKDKGVQRGEFWVRGTSRFNTNNRKEELEKIADLLDVPLRVEKVEKKPKSD